MFRFAFVRETQCIFCEVHIYFLNIIQMKFVLQRVTCHISVTGPPTNLIRT
jgi:hypothetical protein